MEPKRRRVWGAIGSSSDDITFTNEVTVFGLGGGGDRNVFYLIARSVICGLPSSLVIPSRRRGGRGRNGRSKRARNNAKQRVTIVSISKSVAVSWSVLLRKQYNRFIYSFLSLATER